MVRFRMLVAATVISLASGQGHVHAQTTTEPPKAHAKKARTVHHATHVPTAEERLNADIKDEQAKVGLAEQGLVAVIASGTDGGQIDQTDMPPIDGTANLARTFAEARTPKQDDFSPDPTFTAQAGDRFEVRLKAGIGIVVPFSWSYTPGRLAFHVNLDPNRSGAGYGLLMLREGSKSAAGYVGQNAFGATQDVSRMEMFGDELSMLSDPVSSGEEGRYGAEFDLSGNEARALSKNVQLLIQGTLSRLPSGQLAKCEAGGSSATVDNPIDTITHTCRIGVTVSRVAYINTATGAVLKEWTN
jgi:hypothetical protein